MTSPVDFALQHVRLPFEKLHGYQVEDINRACHSESFLFALDMGLGKTVMATLVGVYKLGVENFHSVFVLVPAAMVPQWTEVVSKMGLKCAAYAGTPTQRKKIDRDVDFLILSYQIYQKDYDILKDTNAFYIVDEATNLCNAQNLLYKQLQGGSVTKQKAVPGSIKPVIEKRTFKKVNKGCVLLSGTPINSPLDSWGLIKILSPDIYRNFTQFKRIHIAKEDYFGKPVEFMNLDLLRENLLLNASLRSAEDHIELPEIIYKTVRYELSKKHMELYQKLLNEKLIELEGEVVIDALQVTALYHWCQRVIMRPDLAGLKEVPAGLELLDNLVASKDQCVIFSNYTLTNEFLVDRYEAGACYGGASAAQKKKDIKAFQNKEVKVLCVHPGSGGIGLELQGANTEIFTELPVTPRYFFQSVGRVHRQGQKRTCVIVVMYAAGTIQQTLMARLMERDELTNEIIASPKSLRRDLLSDVVQDTGPRTRAQLIKDLKGEV